jgi:hypothetical protein
MQKDGSRSAEGKVLPKSERGWSIIRWGADHAWLAAETGRNRKGSVRRWCRRWAPWLTDAELDRIVAATVESNKRWSHDHSATVLEITVRDRQLHGFRFLGPSDDADYLIRDELKRKKAAERARRYRAARSTGAKRGRPKSEGVPAWQAAGFSSRRTYFRHKARGTEATQRGTKNPSRRIEKNIQRDGISVPLLRHPPDRPSPARQATGRLAPIIVDNLTEDWGDMVDPVEKAPCAVAAGAARHRHDLEGDKRWN